MDQNKPTLGEIEQNEERIRKSIEEQQALLCAYQLVRRDMLAHSNGATPQKADSEQSGNGSPSRFVPVPGAYGRVTRLVRDELKLINGSFTIRDIYTRLQRVTSDVALGSVTTVFSSLLEREEIKMKRQGRGRQAAIYEMGRLPPRPKLEGSSR
jgi:hypothetical protein